MTQDQKDNISVMNDIVVQLLESGMGIQEILTNLHRGVANVGSDMQIHYLLSVMMEIATKGPTRYSEQLALAMSLNYIPAMSADEYASAIYKSGTNHLMIAFSHQDDVIKLFRYNFETQKWPQVERMVTTAVNSFLVRS